MITRLSFDVTFAPPSARLIEIPLNGTAASTVDQVVSSKGTSSGLIAGIVVTLVVALLFALSAKRLNRIVRTRF